MTYPIPAAVVDATAKARTAVEKRISRILITKRNEGITQTRAAKNNKREDGTGRRRRLGDLGLHAGLKSRDMEMGKKRSRWSAGREGAASACPSLRTKQAAVHGGSLAG